MRTWSETKRELLQNTEVAAEYDAMRPQYEVISQIIKAREEHGMTQAQLADAVGTRQSNISRLESGTYNPSLDLLRRVADGLGKHLYIEFR